MKQEVWTNEQAKHFFRTGQEPGQVKPKSVPRARSEYEVLLAQQMTLAQLPAFKEEYRFLKDRRFRFDFAWPELMVAVEIQGGVWIKGGHSTGAGIIRDAKKANLARINGWLLLTFTPEKIKNGEALNEIEQVLKERMR